MIIKFLRSSAALKNFRLIKLSFSDLLKDSLAEKNKPADIERMIQESYNPTDFGKFNDQNFIEKIKKMEEKRKFRDSKFDFKEYFKNLMMPFSLLLFSSILYYVWKTTPYTVLFKHFTLNEYTIKKLYLHNVFTSYLSFQTKGHFYVYYPLMAVSIISLSFWVKGSFLMSSFLVNCILNSIFTIVYEKNLLAGETQLLFPKSMGSSTSLLFISILGAFNFNYAISYTNLPIWLIPLVFLMYEYYEFKDSHVKEISRPAHILSIFTGTAIGIMLKLTQKRLNFFYNLH